jgi:hypothetical protein
VCDVLEVLLVDEFDDIDEELEKHMTLDERDEIRLDVIDERDECDEAFQVVLAMKLDLDDDDEVDDDDEDSEIDERDEDDDVECE